MLILVRRKRWPRSCSASQGQKRLILASQLFSSFVTEKSLLLFYLLELKDSQEWLQTPPTMWEIFSDYRKLMEYLVNVSVVTDLAERGMHLITEFASKCIIFSAHISEE